MIFIWLKIQGELQFMIFGSKTDVSNLGGISTTTLTQIVNTITAISTLNSALSDKVGTLTFNNFMTNTNNALTLKAPLLNASFTGTMGLNLSNTDTLDSALFIKGVRNDYPTTEGIRFGYSNNINGLTRKSYGIEICSENLACSTIDFSEPTGTHYAGRILYDNYGGALCFTAKTTPSTLTELSFGDYQMSLDESGWLEVKGYIKTPAITLNNVSLQNTLDNFTTSISRLNTTVASVISELTSVENTFGNDILNINTTLPSFLQTTKFNTTINSYLTISNFTSSSLLNTSAFNNTLTSNLSSYTPLTT